MDRRQRGARRRRPAVHTDCRAAFQIACLQRRPSGTSKTHDIFIDLDGLDTDTTLTSLAADINAIDGDLEPASTSNNRLVLNFRVFGRAVRPCKGDDANESGVLAALGLNTFFTGSTASDTRRELRAHVRPRSGGPSSPRASAACGLLKGDNANALRLAEFYTTASWMRMAAPRSRPPTNS